jgi:hypothetical protein
VNPCVAPKLLERQHVLEQIRHNAHSVRGSFGRRAATELARRLLDVLLAPPEAWRPLSRSPARPLATRAQIAIYPSAQAIPANEPSARPIPQLGLWGRTPISVSCCFLHPRRVGQGCTDSLPAQGGRTVMGATDAMPRPKRASPRFELSASRAQGPSVCQHAPLTTASFRAVVGENGRFRTSRERPNSRLGRAHAVCIDFNQPRQGVRPREQLKA